VANDNRTNGAGNGTLFTVVIVVAVLYFARVVLIPVALAVLLAFLLAPLVNRLRHWGLGRVPSVLVVVHFSFLLIGIIGALMASQMTDLGKQLPEYQENVRKKLHSIGNSGGGFINRVTHVVQNLSQELAPPQQRQNSGSADKPVPVEIQKTTFAPLEIVQKLLGSVVNGVLMFVIVIVFVVFMLIQREDLRDRLIRLVGAGQVQVTTQALDDAAQRLSKYLVAQLVVNLAFGILAGIGLYFIGVPNPILWGFLAVLLRYIPYLGIWIAATLPALLVFAVDPGWLKVPLIFGLYGGIDIIMYNVVEPCVYGSSTGVSPVAILLAAVFWTWLWGPMGLLLATPLTVCLAVIGRYVPSMEFLNIMLSDQAPLGPETRFYQRMLAMNLEEATAVAEEFMVGRSLEELYDTVIIPALTLAEEDRHSGRLDEKRQQFIFQNTRLVVEDLFERADELVAGEKNGKSNDVKTETADKQNGNCADAGVICIPARDEADEIAAMMVGQLLEKRGVRVKVLSSAALAGECIEELKQGPAKIACVAVVPPFGYMNARYMCRRLRSQFPDLKIIAAVLTEGQVDELKQRRPAIAADELTSSLKQAVTAILSFMPPREEPVKQAA
jgi:predicted PurR-regulated permease PerM/CheY-like chemotaxis protein